MWATIGHEKQKIYLENALKRNNLAHAYLFCGPDTIGKKMLAYDLFRLVNQREPEGDPDFKLITPRLEDDETKIYIEDTRELKSFLSLKPYYGPYKFVIINDADRLTDEASNSILKILEEPSPFSILILVSSKPKFILPTVVSRCEKMQFLSLHKKEIDKETAKAVDEFMNIAKQGLTERMQYAEKLFAGKNYQNLVVDLIHTLRPQDNGLMLKELLCLNYLLSQPQFNHRLALENFLINL